MGENEIIIIIGANEIGYILMIGRQVGVSES